MRNLYASNPIVRPAADSDIPAILDLIRAKAAFDGCLDALRADEETLRAALFSETPKAGALVAELDGRAVGVATYYDIYSSFVGKPGIWLDDLYVYQEYRGHGIGRKLLFALCEIAHLKGCARIDWIVAMDNDGGRAFYSRLGAEIFERVRHARLNEPAIDRVLSGEV